MAYISIDRQDLRIFVQVIQVLIFSIAHYFICILTVFIYVDAGQEQLRWTH